MVTKLQQTERGYMLIYAVLVVSAMLLFTSIVFRGTLAEFEIARNAQRSAKAFSAAEAGQECVRYWHKEGRSFDTNAAASTISCPVLSQAAAPNTMTVGGLTATTDDPCIAHTYDNLDGTGAGKSFRVGPFPNGSCANVTVEIIPATGNGGLAFCTLYSFSSGVDDCTNPTVGRVVWQSM